jgi:hypothetical protein
LFAKKQMDTVTSEETFCVVNGQLSALITPSQPDSFQRLQAQGQPSEDKLHLLFQAMQ